MITRQAHNLKVAGSNPAPANEKLTKSIIFWLQLERVVAFFVFYTLFSADHLVTISTRLEKTTITATVGLNGHRIFEVQTIFNHPKIQKFMELERFDYVDDNGDLNTNSSIHGVDPRIKFACGIYTFIKKVSQSKN